MIRYRIFSLNRRSEISAMDIQLPCPDQVHFWIARVASAYGDSKKAGSPLSEAEIQRSDRFFSPSDRNIYLHSHALLKDILGVYTKMKFRELTLACGPRGKPFLRNAEERALPNFNMSTAGDMTFIGISSEFDVGVDIEHIGRMPLSQSDMLHVLTQSEQSYLGNVKGHMRQERFLAIWTIKEAYLKAKGCGLDYSPRRLEVRMGEYHAISLIDDSSHKADQSIVAILCFNHIPDHIASAVLLKKGK